MRILLAMPRYDSRVFMEAAQAFYHASSPESPHEIRAVAPASSLATSCFNVCWATARNQWEAGQRDGFAMIHTDVAPQIHWLDILYDEMERVGADLISAAIPIKDHEGMSSTVVDDTGDPWRKRRLSMTEVRKLPVTFTDADVGAPLLLNTGLWLAKLGPWCLETYFRVRHQIVRHAGSGGQWVVNTVPEDWDFSLQCRALGLKLAATRAVALTHYGEWKWSNQEVWGWETDKKNSRQSIACEREGWQFPDDVEGWLTQEEGAALARLAAGKCVLEIGSYCGRSTVCMAQTAAIVHAVDPFDGRATPVGDSIARRGGDLHATFRANLARYGCLAKVVEHPGTSRERVPAMAKHFDLAFIDGAHDPDSVLEDARLAASVLKPAGLLVFHDYRRPTDPGVTAAVDLLIAAGAELLEVADTIAVVRPSPVPELAAH